MAALIECVPNFSEARRPEVVQAIADAIRATPGVNLLNVSSDTDHNRTVITFVGDPAGVEAGAFAGIAKAAELIDMDQHGGAHPRLGATDVVPFIPIREATLADCVTIAQRLGERVGRDLSIPVFLYEAAATRPDRENLADVRRGEYEGLKAEIETNPDRQPDFGPARVGKAGATVIGARAFLIAFNVYLNTADVEVAKKIAKAVRHSSGGLRFVKGLGLLVEGQAQVSMNLTDFNKTPIYRAVEMIRREAARYGCLITHSELVGMIPQAALVDAAQWYLQLDGLKADDILENRLMGKATADGQPPMAEGTPRDNGFLDELAAGTAAPGGGAAAAYAGAMAAGLAGMVARLTLGKKKYAAVEADMQVLIAEAERLRAELTAAVAEDSAAYEAVMAAMKQPKATEAEKAARAEAIQQAMLGAIAVPLRVAHTCAAALDLAAVAAEKGNVNASSDAGSAAQLALAGLRSATLNVRVNAASLTDQAASQSYKDEATALEQSAEAAAARVRQINLERAGLGA
jgi:glutamate formiminotransferase / formiminotetrahydrofolate cyclodeaminase